jgi:hypothetical protein
LRRFYNGYRFSKDPLTVYNPFGILKHFYSGGEFSEYWYESATPSFVVDLLEKHKVNISDIGDMRVRQTDFGKYDIDNMTPAPLLCQAGYLTITGYDERRQSFTLGYPNDEVRTALADSLVKHYLKVPTSRADALHFKLADALDDGDVDAAMETLKLFLAEIPYDIICEKEKYFQTAVHLIIRMLGFDCRSEVRTAIGRIDTLVITQDFVYCIEFKLDGTAEAALAQIDSKEYAFPWTGSGKKVFKVGVNFDFEKRNIGEWVSASG